MKIKLTMIHSVIGKATIYEGDFITCNRQRKERLSGLMVMYMKASLMQFGY